MKKIPYGIGNYELLISDNYYYVDKTMYLEKLENVGNYLLFLRPRRIGKSLLVSMMDYYYDINSKDKFNTLFKDTYVYNNPTNNKNNYYIFRMDFSSISMGSVEVIEKSFKLGLCIDIEFFIHNYNLDYKINKELQISEIFKNFLDYFKSLNLKNKIYIMIDEYDSFANGVLTGDVNIFKDIMGDNGFVRNFYSVIKDYSNSVIDRVFITGVSHIGFDSIKLGFNTIKNITNDIKFNSMLGFTYDETNMLISDLDQKSEVFNEIKKYYDGYLFNEESKDIVFNSTIVMYFIRNYINSYCDDVVDINVVSGYWKIKLLIELYNNDFYKEILDNLFYERSITGELKEYFDINTPVSKNDIISLLYYFGYLTIDKKIDNLSYKFKIPNKVMDLVYNEYYLSFITNYSFNYDKLDAAIKELCEKGNINILCSLVSDIIKNISDNICISFNEKSIALIIYSLLAKCNEFDIYFKYQIKINILI